MNGGILAALINDQGIGIAIGKLKLYFVIPIIVGRNSAGVIWRLLCGECCSRVGYKKH
jgi:hypothetical protein